MCPFVKSIILAHGSILVAVAAIGSHAAEKSDSTSRPKQWVATQKCTLQHDRAANVVAFSPSSKRVLTAASDLTVRLWDVESGRELNRFTGNKAWHMIRDIAWSPDGCHAVLAGGQYKGTERLTLWDVEKWREARRFDDLRHPVTRAVFSADGRRIAAGTDGGNVFVWNVDSGKRISHFEPKVGRTRRVDRYEPDDETAGLDISPDGTRGLWSGGFANYQLRIFDIQTGRKLRRLEPEDASVGSSVLAVFANDSQWVLAADTCSLRLWDSGTGKATPPVKVTASVVASLALSSDQQLIVVGAYDGEIALWNFGGVRDARLDVSPLLVLQKPHPAWRRVNAKGQIAAGIQDVAVSENLQYVGAADHDGTVRIWKLAEP